MHGAAVYTQLRSNFGVAQAISVQRENAFLVAFLHISCHPHLPAGAWVFRECRLEGFRAGAVRIAQLFKVTFEARTFFRAVIGRTLEREHTVEQVFALGRASL